MATRQEITELLRQMRESSPGELINNLDKSRVGMMSAMVYLYEHDLQATPGEISSAVSVSTARMAVMLKSLEGKGLIIRKHHPDDARKMIIRLSEAGEKMVYEKHQWLIGMMTRLVDRIGYERMKDYVCLTREITAFCESEMLMNTDRQSPCL